MRSATGLCLVVTLLSFVIANPQTKQCNGCVDYGSCAAARDLLLKGDPASVAQLKLSVCAYNQAGLPKFCCSDLTITTPARVEQRDGMGSVEAHPNLSLLPKDCGEIESDRIIGGTVAGLYQYPWMVLLGYNGRDGTKFDCGGTLINEWYVLTAAHCITKELAGVRIGEHDINTVEDCQGVPPHRQCESHIQDVHVQKVIKHPEFSSNIKARDIALIRLREKADFSHRNARAVCLPVTPQLQARNLVGLNATVTGWGITETTYRSSKLLAVDVPIATSESCAVLVNRLLHGNGEENYKICAGRGGHDSCTGDSGGPLMLKGLYRRTERMVEYGIVSTGPINCGTGIYGTYTNVAKHMEWILDNMEP